MNKIKSFTIIEIIISMVITSVVIGIAFSSFIYFRNQFSNYIAVSSELANRDIFQKTLQHDVEKADFIVDSMPGILAFYNDNSITLLKFDSSQVLRDVNGLKESFPVTKCEWSITHFEKKDLIVESILVHFPGKGNTTDYYFIKHYSAEQLMKADRYSNERTY